MLIFKKFPLYNLKTFNPSQSYLYSNIKIQFSLKVLFNNMALFMKKDAFLILICTPNVRHDSNIWGADQLRKSARLWNIVIQIPPR